MELNGSGRHSYNYKGQGSGPRALGPAPPPGQPAGIPLAWAAGEILPGMIPVELKQQEPYGNRAAESIFFVVDITVIYFGFLIPNGYYGRPDYKRQVGCVISTDAPQYYNAYAIVVERRE